MTMDYLEKWKSELRDRKEKAKADLYFLLDQHPNITAIDVEWDGFADSGQIEHIACFTASGEDVDVAIELNDAVEEYVYAILPGGWEINEGSFGTVHIDVKARTAKCDFAWRTTEDASFTEE